MTETALQKTNGRAADEADARTVTVAPRADVLETDDEFLVLLDMPGVQPGDVDVRFENGELSVLGRRHPSHPEKARGPWEYDLAGFQRTFRVADHIAADKIEAELKNGVLTLRLPKPEAVKPRRIAVRG
jgi:HSP20 family protein